MQHDEIGFWADWKKHNLKRPELFLECFGVDTADRFAMSWVSLCVATYTGTPQPQTVAELCRAVHMPRPALYVRMKKVLAPVFEYGDEHTMKLFGMHPCETVTELARNMAEVMKRDV